MEASFVGGSPPVTTPNELVTTPNKPGTATDEVDPGVLADWLLSSQERGNRYTSLAAWTTGNAVRALVHGRAYFAALHREISGAEAGDIVMFTDWRGDPDEVVGGDTSISRVLCEAAARGVVVKGLVWRSHWDKLQFSEEENRHLGEEIEAAGGECLLDMRVRSGGSHHQKMVVVRHPGRPERDVAYVGGIDLCHGRHDDATHGGDPQSLPMATEYGDTPPWHDIQLEIRGPAVGAVEATFRERWTDPTPLSRNPMSRLADLVRRDDTRPDPLPPQPADPAPCGTQAVQVLRTYPYRRPGYPFAPYGERSVARAYTKALRQARHLIYLEDQYLWSTAVVRPFAEALMANPELRMIAVVPLFPDQPGRLAGSAQVLGRTQAVELLEEAGGDRFAVYGLENHAGVPVYVHAKACVIDDVWCTVGSDNLNLRSWTHDSELSCAVMDEGGDFPRDLRLTLAREHLDRPAGADDLDLADPLATFTAYAAAADALDAWHARGRTGPRPPGRLRRYQLPHVSGPVRRVAEAAYRTIYDPDGRPPSMRRRQMF